MRKPKLEVDAPKKKRILVQEGPVFNEYNKESIYSQLRRGLHFNHAAKITGVSERTANGWHQQGKTDQIDFEDGFLDHQTEKAVFYTKCEQAKSEFIAKGIDKIRDNDDWRATQFLLITSDRDGYQPTQKVTLDKTNTNKVVFEIVDSATWKKDQVEDSELSQITDENMMEAEYVEEEGTE